MLKAVITDQWYGPNIGLVGLCGTSVLKKSPGRFPEDFLFAC